MRTRENAVVSVDEFKTGEGVCFPLGSKIKIDEIYFTSGGGGTNTAATFAKQGFSVAYCGKIGKDNAGDGVIKDLNHYGINSSLVSYTDKKPTNHSVVLDVPNKDRTILVYRGASDSHEKKDVDFEKLRASWFYLTSFSTHSKELFSELIDFALSANIKIMANPGKAQLRDEKIKEQLKRVDILLLNLEEASILTGIDFANEEEILKAVSCFGKEVVIVTKGVEGVIVYGKGKYYHSKPVFLDAVDRTGAGDSLGAGFLAEYMRSKDIRRAVQLGIANSTACLQKKGAKHGLLKKDEEFCAPSVEENDSL